MFGRMSLQVKYILITLLTILLVAAALLVGLQFLKTSMLRNEAQAVASQVVSFRSWVANSGMVWVDGLSKDFHDFLAKRPDADGNFFFGKNPALATRELSTLANASSTRATFRVTSDEYRHPDNKPDDFEQAAIEAFKADKDKGYVDGFDAGSYRYAQPIYVKASCLRCHGDPAEAPPAVIEKYGDQKAFGYKVGDVRGIIGVQLPDVTLAEVLPVLTNPYTIGLLVLAVLINILFTQYGLIRRLRRLTRDTTAIAEGELDQPLVFRDPAKSRDEVDQVSGAIDLLRSSLRVAMRHMQKK